MVHMRLENARNHPKITFFEKFSKKKFIFKIRFLDVSDHFKSFGTHFWRHFFEKFHCKFLFVQSDARACSCLSFFENECNDYIWNTHLQCSLDVFHTFTKIWANISFFHGAYEAQNTKNHPKIVTHFFKKRKLYSAKTSI